MQERINTVVRPSFKKAFLPAIAMAALLAGLTTAKAWDQQATGAEMDYELSQRAVTEGFGQPESYAQAHAARPNLHRHRAVRGRADDQDE